MLILLGLSGYIFICLLLDREHEYILDWLVLLLFVVILFRPLVIDFNIEFLVDTVFGLSLGMSCKISARRCAYIELRK